MLDNAPPPLTRRRCPPVLALRLGLLLLWAAALAYLSLAPEVKAPSGAFGWDKLNHFAAYAALGILTIRCLMTWYPLTIGLLIVAWSVCAGYGLLLESLQSLMGIGRQWEFGDLLANALGALAACVVFRHMSGRSSPTNDC